ncbi:aminoglycoside phosphotransferase family protein [Actinoalloteichus hymeniacidonis]|uniref:Streptomycin 6-kinase n=1 Tax=Actinoalloteichus hymeniacidonis TaxID=340345 RepID=A0AAC9HQN9_9PSEU|nr:aminoglycoside phosphotransferase family protein [Actinoalloteichus hymeniacidonis]AOS63655.1 streptomycin 6-kinase [Actinoalloteichus hymeniacidonis]MBB5908297.1 streptomycin 6-kinase [Actinoalloteichus hymeniacidonis]
MSCANQPVVVPEGLARFHQPRRADEGGPEWIAALPTLAAEMLQRWQLRVSGPARHGMVALVLPVIRTDGSQAAVKFQPVNEENIGEPLGLRRWDGDGAVRLLDEDTATGTLLLERLDGGRSLADVPDIDTALRVLADLAARLSSVAAPAELRTLADIAAAMLADAPTAVPRLASPDHRELVRDCAAAVAEVIDEPGDRLLHWDLHYENVLAAPAGSDREPWLAIDPKPLAGDPGFEILPALDNRWDDITVTGDVPRSVLWRFDLLTEAMGLDRRRAAGWTLGRVLQNSLWGVADGSTTITDDQTAIAAALLENRL